jgi:hypothetical protein
MNKWMERLGSARAWIIAAVLIVIGAIWLAADSLSALIRRRPRPARADTLAWQEAPRKNPMVELLPVLI